MQKLLVMDRSVKWCTLEEKKTCKESEHMVRRNVEGYGIGPGLNEQ